MIDYGPFWSYCRKNWKQRILTLANKLHISNSTLHRLKHNKDVSTKTLNDLCKIS